MKLNEYIEMLKKAGFVVFMSKGAETFCHFALNNQIGYVQCDKYGSFHFTTTHKANRQCGTGFMIHDDIYEPTIQHALDCFVFAPAWATSDDLKSIVKYASTDEYIKAEKVLEYHYV